MMEGSSSASCSQSDCMRVHPFIFVPVIKERKYVTFQMGSLAMADVWFRDINCLNLMRKSLVSLRSLENFSGGFPLSHPSEEFSLLSCGRSQMLNGSSPVPLGRCGSFPFAVDDLSLIPSSCLGSKCTSMAAQDGGRLHCSSAGVGSLLSTRLCRFIPG
jgi:hypothetical protein